MSSMDFSAHDVSIKSFIHSFDILAAILEKGEAHAKETGINPDSYLDLKLAEDMLPFKTQIMLASNFSKFTATRVGGVENEVMEDNAETYADLKDRVARTKKFLQGVNAASMEGSGDKLVEFKAGNGAEFKFTRREYITSWGIPNVWFHLVTAYNILRNNGVQLGKLDFLYAPGETKPMTL